MLLRSTILVVVMMVDSLESQTSLPDPADGKDPMEALPHPDLSEVMNHPDLTEASAHLDLMVASSHPNLMDGTNKHP